MVPDAVPLGEVRRALVVKLRHHGDVLLSSPVFTALKAAAPHVDIDALVYADTAAMLTFHPAIAEVHCIDRRWKELGPLAQLRAEWQLLATLRARGYDLLIHLTEHRRGAWLARLLRPRWAVTHAVRGRGRFWQGSFTHFAARPGNARRHTVEIHLDTLRRIGIYPEERQMTLVPGPDAEARIAALLAEKGLPRGAYVHIHPASRWLFKCWTVDGWAAVIGELQRQGWPVVLTAAPAASELAMLAAIQARLPQPAVELGGQLSLKDMAALTAGARLFMGVDSAPMHIAAATGTPVVVLFGPSGDLEWGPWQVPHRTLVSAHSCRPCGLDGCGGGKVSDCLVSLPAERVLAAASELLAP